MNIDSVAENAFRCCVQREEESLNDLLSAFNTALSFVGLKAKYIQLGDYHATWQADSQSQVDLARRFHSELVHCLTTEDVKRLLREYRKQYGGEG